MKKDDPHPPTDPAGNNPEPEKAEADERVPDEDDAEMGGEAPCQLPRFWDGDD
jgi:hypothetical protein